MSHLYSLGICSATNFAVTRISYLWACHYCWSYWLCIWRSKLLVPWPSFFQWSEKKNLSKHSQIYDRMCGIPSVNVGEITWPSDHSDHPYLLPDAFWRQQHHVHWCTKKPSQPKRNVKNRQENPFKLTLSLPFLGPRSVRSSFFLACQGVGLWFEPLGCCKRFVLRSTAIPLDSYGICCTVAMFSIRK